MNSHTLIKSVLVVVISSLCVSSFSKEIQRGTNEINGNASFSINFNSYGNSTNLSLSPSYFYYLTDILFIGPLVSYSGTWIEGYSNSYYSIGGAIGILLNNNQTNIPYLGVGAESFKVTESTNGLLIPVFVGLKFRLSESFFLNIQPTYTYTKINNYSLSTILLGLGFSGIF